MKKESLLSKEALLNGQVIAFPTETVMGLGVIFDNEQAYSLLNKIKRRPEDKPYTLMLGDVNDIEKYAHLSLRDRLIISKFMPGPLTVLLKAKENVPGYVTHNTGIIGVRVPNMPEIQEMINFIGKPLLVPSANRSGEKPFVNYLDVEKEFGKELGYIYPKNALGEKPSTIIDLTSDRIIEVRTGSISIQDIEKELVMLKVAVGSDHGGYEAKEELIKHLKNNGVEVFDCGTNSLDSCDYPIFGVEVAKNVANKVADYGVVICTSGEGIMMAANKVKGIRCGLGYNDEVSKLMRQHNDANMIAFGAKFMSAEEINKRVDIFLSTEFEGGRHQRRVDIIKSLEE